MADAPETLAAPCAAHVPKDRVAGFCRANGIRKLSIFGSALRSDFGPESDIDVLVEFAPGRAQRFGSPHFPDYARGRFSRGLLGAPASRRHLLLNALRALAGETPAHPGVHEKCGRKWSLSMRNDRRRLLDMLAAARGAREFAAPPAFAECELGRSRPEGRD